MALYGYRPKTKKAPWTTMPNAKLSKQEVAKFCKKLADNPPTHARVAGKWTRIAPQTATRYPKRKKAIRAQSPKQAARKRRYAKIAREFLSRPENAQCRVFPTQPACEVHHMRGRHNDLLFDVRGFLPVSRLGHDFIHRNITRAQEMGLIASDKWRVQFETCGQCNATGITLGGYECSECEGKGWT